MYAVCVHKSLCFPVCNIAPYLLYCSAHYSLGLTKQHSLSPTTAKHPTVMLASTSAHLGCTHCINCSTDLVNCLSVADVRKRREESDRESERENWNDIVREGTNAASFSHCSSVFQTPPFYPSFSLWTNKFASSLDYVCFHLPNEKETFLHISLPRGFSPSTENARTQRHKLPINMITIATTAATIGNVVN